MWDRDEDRIALVELLLRGVLPRREAQTQAWLHLEALPWVRRAKRRGELELVEDHRRAIEDLLDRLWPQWRQWVRWLEEASLPATPAGLRRLRDMQRAAGLGPLPDRLNLRTATSAVAPHSKSTLGASRREALGATEIVRDAIVRVRPPAGVELVRGDTCLAAAAITDVLGELAIPERALRDGTRIEGPARAILLVENLGPYQDLDPPRGWFVAHVPGWNTAALQLFLAALPTLPVVHFGDLDPAGVRIHEHLRSIHASLHWAVPTFWAERVGTHAQRGNWPDDLDLSSTPPLVQELAAAGLWLEQECIALDPRLPAELEAVIG